MKGGAVDYQLKSEVMIVGSTMVFVGKLSSVIAGQPDVEIKSRVKAGLSGRIKPLNGCESVRGAQEGFD